jgi:hypothetical protein
VVSTWAGGDPKASRYISQPAWDRSAERGGGFRAVTIRSTALLGGEHGLGTDHHRDDHRDYRRRSSQTSKGARTRIVPHQIINAQAAWPRPLVRAALLDLLGLVSLIVSP